MALIVRWLVTCWHRYRAWRTDRLRTKFAIALLYCLLDVVEDSMGCELATDADRLVVAQAFADWVSEDLDARLNQLMTNPERTVYLFRSQWQFTGVAQREHEGA